MDPRFYYKNYQNYALNPNWNYQYGFETQNLESCPQVLTSEASEAWNETGTTRDADETTRSSEASEKRNTKSNYERWAKEEEKYLVELWVEKHDMLESKDARKTWKTIVDELNKLFKSSKTVDKCQRKMKYMVTKYKGAKEWNRKQSGGNIKKSIYYDQIDSVLGCRDVVTFRHVVESRACSSPSTSSAPSPGASSENGDNEADSTPSPEERTERKKGGKGKKRKARQLDDTDEEYREILSGIQKQSGEVTEVLKSMQQTQMQQMNLLSKFVEKFCEKN